MREVFHPRSTMAFLLVLFLLALIYDNPGLLFAMLAGLALLNLQADHCAAWFKMLKYAVPFMLFILLINVMVSQQGPVWWTGHLGTIVWAIHGPAVVYGLTMSLRLLVVLSVFTVFNILFSVEELLEVIPAGRGTAIIVAVITARMVPDLGQRVRGIQEMQLTRCGDVGGNGLIERCRRTGVLLLNVLRAAMEGAWKSGEVMQARGFGAADVRTVYRRHRWRMRDNGLVLAALVAFFSAVASDIWTGTGYITIVWGGVFPLALLGMAWLALPAARAKVAALSLSEERRR